MTRDIIRRPKVQEDPKGLDDATKFLILKQYSDGIPVVEIAKGVSRDRLKISEFIQSTLRSMQTIRETNDLVIGTHSAQLKIQQGATPTKFLTSSFLSALEDGAEMYAYYFAQTGDNKFALMESGLAVGIPKNMRKSTKEYVYRIRGQFVRDIAPVKKIIKTEQDRRIKEYHIEKPQVQMEIVRQIEELKETVANDPRQRINLLKAIEMLGRSIGAFTDRIETEETNAKSGLQILMDRAKSEAGEEVYEQAKE